jgi:hypothetical protein
MSNLPSLKDLIFSKNWAQGTIIPLLLICLLISFFALLNINDSLLPRFKNIESQPPMCWLDYSQNYLMAKAALMGLNPYASIAELFSNATPGMICSGEALVKFPSPHPPTSIFFYIPFTYFSNSLNQSALIWTIFSLSMLLCSLIRLLATLELKPLQYINLALILFLCTLGTRAIEQDLWLVNMQTFILSLALELLRSLKKKNDTSAGFFLGLMLSIKLLGAPLIIFFAFQRKFKIIVTSLAVTSVTVVLTGMTFGFSTLSSYPAAASITIKTFHHDSMNFSLFLLGQRLFGSLEPAIDAYDIFHAPALPPLSGLMLPELICDWIGCLVVIFTICLFCTRKIPIFIGTILVLCVTPAVQPISWYYTESLSLIAVATLSIWAIHRTTNLLFRLICWPVIFIAAVSPSRILQILHVVELAPYQSALVLFLDSVTMPAVAFLLLLLVEKHSKYRDQNVTTLA